ncbi:MAG: hypothetical protein JWM85_2471 [Acidimicrobiaceae bacterium]|nr:hypothetical protein [Acidimicrobiaceae bacterium]
MPYSEPSNVHVPSTARLRAWMATPGFGKMWRYGATSVITTTLSLGLLYLFYRIVKVGSLHLGGWVLDSSEVSNILATAIVTIPSYNLNRSWTWGKSGKSHVWREVVPFWVIAAISLALSTLVVGVASHEAHRISSRREVQTLLVELGNLSTYGVIWGAKFMIFNRILFKHKSPLASPVDEVPAGAAAEHAEGDSAATTTALVPPVADSVRTPFASGQAAELG